MRIRSIIVVLFAAVVATLGIQAPADAAGRVKITKVYFDSPGGDNGSNISVNAEYVTIKNNTSHTKTLTGWTLRDRQSYHVYTFATFKLQAGEKVRVHSGSGTDTAHHLYWGEGYYIWNNTGDTAKLRKTSGTLVNRCKFSDAGSYKIC